MSAKHPMIRKATAKGVKAIAAAGIAILLSGCIVVPVGGGYYHPHHHWGY